MMIDSKKYLKKILKNSKKYLAIYRSLKNFCGKRKSFIVLSKDKINKIETF